MSAMKWPLYKSHKMVRALEIDAVDAKAGKVSFINSTYPEASLSGDIWARYQPVKGDFLVEYEDGYKSFSPRDAFIGGYTAVAE